MAAAVLALTSAVLPAAADPTESAPPSTPPASETSTAATTTTTTPTPPPSSGATGAPAAEDPAQRSVADLAVTATFDKQRYRTGEDMRITLAITNNGPAPAIVVAHFPKDEPDHISVRDGGDLGLGRSLTVAAGATHTTNLVGAIGNPDVTLARLTVFLGSAGTASREFTFTVPVTPTFGHASGTVFADRNDNGTLDDGEGLPGVRLTWTNQLHDRTTFTVTTDAAGRFTLPRLPTAPYRVVSSAPDGWLVGYRQVTVDEDGVDDLLLRAVRSLSGLTANLAFTKDVYQPTERVTVKVTLANATGRRLAGIVVWCNRAGSANSLEGAGTGWGRLAGDGVTVEKGQTLVLEVTEDMPKDAVRYGSVHVGCTFLQDGVDDDANPDAYDIARVPGAFGDVVGDVKDHPNGHDKPGIGIGDVRVVLVGEGRCPILAETRTDAAGHFELRNVPAGDHDVYLFPPAGWRIEHDNPTATLLVAPGPSRLGVEAEPGSAPAPTLPAQPADCAGSGGPAPGPAPQAGAAPGLADTGASILVPTLFGLVALLAGIGGVLAARRPGRAR